MFALVHAEAIRVVTLHIISLSGISIFFKELAKMTLVKLPLSIRVRLTKQFEIKIDMTSA